MPDYPDWMRVVGFFGQDPEGNLILIQVDDDGHLEIPLKGTFEGELVTIGVDANGYLAAYVLDDESQWGDIIKVGNAELAARLRSPVTWDWRGKVQVIHDFASGMQGLKVGVSGTGAAITLDPRYSQFGGYSARLVGGSDTAWCAWLSGWSSPSPSRFVGVACSFSVEQAPKSVDLALYAYDSGKYYTYRIRYRFEDYRLQYQDSEAEYQDIATYKIHCLEHIFYHMKVVADLETHTYERVLFGSQEYPLTAIPRTVNFPTIPDYIMYEVVLFSDDGDNDVVYVDHIILTSGEPEND